MPQPRPLVRAAPAPDASPTPCPNDDLRLLIELLRPAGPALGRRWLAALLLAPEADRLAIVESVEQRMAAMYGARAPALTTEADKRRPARSSRRAG